MIDKNVPVLLVSSAGRAQWSVGVNKPGQKPSLPNCPLAGLRLRLRGLGFFDELLGVEMESIYIIYCI